MALESPVLDDITWKDLVDLTRRRIPAASRGRWTLHAPVDPGITILELTAWLLEQRLYWLDRVSDPFGHAVAGLLGERPRSARAASTVLRVAPDTTTQPTLVAKGTRMQLRTTDAAVVVTLTDSLAALPVDRVRVVVDGRDRTDDLELGWRIDLTGEDTVEVRFVLELDASYDPRARLPSAPIALFLELETSEGMPLEWTPLDEPIAAVDPLPVRWSYRDTRGDDKPFPPTGLGDGTLGLRRSGIVRLTPGTDWALDGKTTSPSYTFTLRFEPEVFPSPPRIQSVAANAVVARNRHTAPRVKRVKGWLGLPDSVIQLAQSADALPIESSVRLWLAANESTAAKRQWVRWTRVDDFARSGPTDRHFVVERERACIRFGTGLNGRIPQGNANEVLKVRVKFDVGGGEGGNVGVGLEWRGLSGSEPFVAWNLLAGEGGRESETLAQLHERIASELSRPSRAVVTGDFAQVIRSAGLGIRRVYAAFGHHPAFPCSTVPGAVTVFCVPDVPRAERWDDTALDDALIEAPRPDAAVLAAVQRRLENARLAGSELFVCPPRYRRVALAFHVVSACVSSDALRERVRRRVTWFLDPLVGGDLGTGWEFGASIQPSALLREGQAAVGTEGRVERVEVGLDGEAPQFACDDIPILPHELVVAAEVTVQIHRPVPSSTDAAGLQ